MNPAPFCLIGIVNVTPDSFSDGGKYIDPCNAVAHGLRLLDEGAGMLDLGAESTRPFAEPVPEGEEIARLMPVVARLREQRPDAVLSVDTLKAGTARAALEGGADIINDVSPAWPIRRCSTCLPNTSRGMCSCTVRAARAKCR